MSFHKVHWSSQCPGLGSGKEGKLLYKENANYVIGGLKASFGGGATWPEGNMTGTQCHGVKDAVVGLRPALFIQCLSHSSEGIARRRRAIR